MSFSQITFMGASVRDFKSSLSWNLGGLSQLTILLVEDPSNGDAFVPPAWGTPAFFEFGDFRFSGLFQKHQKTNDVNGFPAYEVVLIDPREILEGAQIILGGYSGSVGTVNNLINVFGWWENTVGFGQSQSNDGGMPFNKVKTALLGICNQPNFGTYGGPLTFRGISYSLDLSELPATPDYYRVGGGLAANLLELISVVCEDGGFDFFVDLVGYTIRIRTAPRINEPPLGTISSIVNNTWANATVRSGSGVEVRNETTAAFLVGGLVSSLHLTSFISSFWGYDINGNPILGTGAYKVWFPTWHSFVGAAEPVSSRPRPKIEPQQPETIPSPPGTPLGEWEYTQVGTENFEAFALNADRVASIVGSTSYPCTSLELRHAKAGMGMWLSYINAYRPDIAQIVDAAAVLNNQKNLVPLAKADLVNDVVANVIKLAQAAISTQTYTKLLLMYEFVKGYADEYMGRKYAVALPFLVAATDSDTAVVYTSYDVTDGGYLPEGSAPLGLNAFNEDIFTHADGRFKAFVKIDGIRDNVALDMNAIPPQNSVIQDTNLYTQVQVNPQIILTPSPAVVMTLQGPLLEETKDGLGDRELVFATLQMTPTEGQRVFNRPQFGTMGGRRLSPACRAPVLAAIPLRSNTLTYGPWSSQGATGKVRFEQDESLVPWNYGGFDYMNLVANSRVNLGVSAMQLSESGYIEKPGSPGYSLGDVLQAGGPNITNINVSFSKEGVTTSYYFQTYTPRFGVFSKGQAERLRRAGFTGQQLRRALRTTITENNARAGTVADANSSKLNRKFFENAPNEAKRESPNEILVGHSIDDTDNNRVRVGTVTATSDEALSFTNADDDTEFRKTSSMSLTGLVRGFSTNPNGTGILPAYAPAISGGFLNKDLLNPFQSGNDIEFYHWGNSYEGYHTLRHTPDNTNARPMALRGPLVMTGWGMGTDCECKPGNGMSFTEGYLHKSNLWKTGPADLLWDEKRGVWTCHDLLKGTVLQTIATNGSGICNITPSTGLTYDTYVYNYLGQSATSGTQALVGYVPTDNRWYILAANNPGNSGALNNQILRGTLTTNVATDGFGSGLVQINGSGSTIRVYNHFEHTYNAGARVLLGYVVNDNKYYLIGETPDSSGGILKGTLQNTIGMDQSGLVTVSRLNGSSYNQYVYNHFEQTSNSGARVLLGYISTDDRWYILGQSGIAGATGPSGATGQTGPSGAAGGGSSSPIVYSIKGTLNMVLPAGSSGELGVISLLSGNYNQYIYNYFSSAVASGTKVIASWVGNDSRYYAVAADCI